MGSMNLISGPGFISGIVIGDAGVSNPTVPDSIPVLTQVNGAPVAAALEVQSTLGGLLPPRMTTIQRNAISPLVAGMTVYDTDLGALMTYDGAAWGIAGGFKSTTLLTAQITTLNSVPVALVPPVAVNQIIIPTRLVLYVPVAGAAYTTASTLKLVYTTGPAEVSNPVVTYVGVSATPANGLLSAAVPKMAYSSNFTAGLADNTSLDTTNRLGSGLSLTASADMGGGVGRSMIVNLTYQILTVS